MHASLLIARVCSLPRDFRRGEKSAVQLLAEAGFFDAPDVVSLGAVRSRLAADPALVEDWVTWSADRRTGSGWYLLDDGTVGCLPDGPILGFGDMLTACAEFIVRELADHRRHAL